MPATRLSDGKMEYFINGHLQLLPGTSKEEIEALYMAERLKRKVHKKGPAPKLLGNERCEICGQLANGFHYNVLRNQAQNLVKGK